MSNGLRLGELALLAHISKLINQLGENESSQFTISRKGSRFMVRWRKRIDKKAGRR